MHVAITAAVFVFLAMPLAARAQPAGKVYRIGLLSPTSQGLFEAAFREGLRTLGYVEGHNIVIEYRSADGRFDRLPDLAADLVRLQVDVIVASPTFAALEAPAGVPGGGGGKRERQTLTMNAVLTPGTTPTLVDAYVVVQLPSGQFFSVLLTGVAGGIVPIAVGFQPFAFSGQLIAYTFTGLEGPGTYTVFAALTQPGTLTSIGQIQMITFTFSP